MKLGKLFLLALALFAFGLTSCGKDDDNDCTRCKLAIPILDDCEIDVCPDGSTTTVGGGINCAGGEAALALRTTKAHYNLVGLFLLNPLFEILYINHKIFIIATKKEKTIVT